MAVLDLFKRKSPIEKALKDLREPYAQPEYRRAAMDKLFQLGTVEAYTAVLQRFTYNASGQIADESEKIELVERLVETGAATVEPLKRFVATEKKISFAISALVRILPKDEVLSFLRDVLAAYEPLDHRTTEAKLNLVVSIADLMGKESGRIFVPYLGDHSDDVQFQAITALEKVEDVEMSGALCNVCCSDAHSARIQRRAAQALMDLKWPVKDAYERFVPDLKAEYLVSKKGHLVKKSSASSE